MIACYVCAKTLNPRTTVRYDMDTRTFCGLRCVFKYRGGRRLA